jgi:hypothetical protein
LAADKNSDNSCIEKFRYPKKITLGKIFPNASHINLNTGTKKFDGPMKWHWAGSTFFCSSMLSALQHALLGEMTMD